MGKYGWDVQPKDVLCGPAPISLAGGYSTVATIPFRFGAAASLIPKFTPDGLFELIQNHKVTILSALPTAYRKMLEVAGAEKKYDLSSLRVLTGGGESLTAKTYLDWKARFGQEIYEGLGTTEMMYVFVSSVVTRKVKPGAIGTAVPGYEIQVITEEGKVAKPGELGRLYARGPTGTLYWRPLEEGGSQIGSAPRFPGTRSRSSRKRVRSRSRESWEGSMPEAPREPFIGVHSRRVEAFSRNKNRSSATGGSWSATSARWTRTDTSASSPARRI